MTNNSQKILQKLIEHSSSGTYPFHMPGHKRQHNILPMADFPNPFSIDITEVEGFDNLHRPKSILKESMSWAANVYGSDRTYYLINGSSSGILSSISGAVARGSKVLVSRNSHKSVYNGALLRNLDVSYIYPQVIPEIGIQGGISPNDVEAALRQDSDIQAVMIVSPTYEGVVSDVESIADVVHNHNIPLIVDEAHGAHFSFAQSSPYFPRSSLELGADIVIQSVHKTLPSLTQTAVMHIKKGRFNADEVDRYAHIYQSTSPSYVFLASIEQCIAYMNDEGRVRMKSFGEDLKKLRGALSALKHLKLIDSSLKGHHQIFDIDPSKIVISTRRAGISGPELDEKLRRDYKIEMEMHGLDYVTAITSICDTKDSLERLAKALQDIDATLSLDDAVMNAPSTPIKHYQSMKITEALEAPRHRISITEATGRVSAEFVYIYPPGIPIIAPGEVFTETTISTIMQYRELGFKVQDSQDEIDKKLFVVK